MEIAKADFLWSLYQWVVCVGVDVRTAGGKATGSARGSGQAEGRSEQDEGLAVICLLLLLRRTRTTWMEGEKQRVEVR